MESKRAAPPLLGVPRLQALDRARALLTSTWTLGLLVFCLTWAGGFVAPRPFSLDISTYAGLSLAAELGIDHGAELIFSYGPLGFLKTYLAFHEWPARLAVLYGIVLHLALSVSLVWAARRSYPLLLALAAALVAALLMRGDLGADAVRTDAAVVGLALIWCIAALAPGSPAWVRRLVLVGGGAFAAIELLAKLNTGLVVLALVVVTAIALEEHRRRNLGILGAVLLGSLVALWFAAGQGIGDVGPFLSGSWEIVSGYSSGARLEWETRDFDYVLAPAIVAVVGALAWLATKGWPGPRRLATLGILAIVAFTAFKAGFVSHDEFHMATFFATMLGACIALPVSRLGLRIGAGLAIAGIAIAGFTPAFEGYPLTDPTENIRTGAETLATLADPGRLEDEIETSRAAAAAAYGLDERTLAALEGRTVHVDPAEAAAVWAYGLQWRPVPAFQPYVAWTEDLDDRNADALESAGAPERILRQAANPLGRYPGFDSPATMVAMLCNYAPLHTGGAWQVLGRIPDRCGEPRSIGSASGASGEPIEVPPAGRGELVVGRVDGVQVDGLERLEAMLYRPGARRVSFDEGDGYVFIEGTAANGLLLRAPEGLDYPGEFGLAPNSDQIRFLTPGTDEITVDFYAVPIGR
ncbi:MAG TPA: hypothetical protein VFY99_03250 [Solirubrobacterales bacterium]